MGTRPNIVIIYADQLRHDAVGALGNPRISTPNIDHLVREGTAFIRAATPCPVCMPARWSLHTGQWTTTHGCYSNHHPGPKPEVHLPGLLREHGYRTGLVGKNHSFLTPDDLDVFCEHPEPVDPAAARERAGWLERTGRPYQPRLAREPVPGGVAADPDHAKTDAAIRFIGKDSGSPFFLWLSYDHPHTPYYVPEPYYSMYKEDPLGIPDAEEERAAKPFRQQFHRRNNDALLPFDPGTVRHMRQVYGGMVSLLDAEMGRFLQALDTQGLADDTLVVFMSDHGDYMGEHGLFTKSPSLYDCLVRTPLVIRWPGRIPAGHTSTEPVSHVDIMPTLLAAAEIPAPGSVQGMDLLPLLFGDASGLRDVVFSEYGIPGEPYTPERLAAEKIAPGNLRNPWDDRLPWEGNPVSLAGRIRMACTERWKLVRETGGTGELYDLANDPSELRNLFRAATHRQVRSFLEKSLDDWLCGLPDPQRILRITSVQ